MEAMPYPYCLIGTKIKPIFGDLQKGAPLYVSLASDSPYRAEFENKTQQMFYDALQNKIHTSHGAKWSVGGYLEDRSLGLQHYPQMALTRRYYHIGIDINFPTHTPIYAPLDAVVVRSEYEEGEGNYGGLAVLRCHENGSTFYLLFGHLERESLPTNGAKVAGGEQIARIGDFHDNGQWYPHLHLQVLTEKAYAEGWVNKGYCTLDEIPTLNQYAPDPTPLLFTLS